MKTDWTSSVNWVNVKIGLEKYNAIMEHYNQPILFEKWLDDYYRDFRRRFNHFYRMRRGETFQKEYYTLLLQNKGKDLNFEKIFLEIKDKTGRIEPSFASKLVATVNPDLPIWDSEVLKKLGKKAPPYYDKNRASKVIDCYNDIVEWYRSELKSANGLDMIQAFNRSIGESNISATKKIDFMLWQKDR